MHSPMTIIAMARAASGSRQARVAPVGVRGQWVHSSILRDSIVCRYKF